MKMYYKELNCVRGEGVGGTKTQRIKISEKMENRAKYDKEEGEGA